MPILLNGFKVQLSSSTFQAYIKDMPDNKDFKALQQKYEHSLFLYWSRGKLYGIPKKILNTKPSIELFELNCEEHLRLLNARIANVLPEIFPEYSPSRRRPFTFLAQKYELISTISKKLYSVPSLLKAFAITPRFSIESKTIELRPGEVNIGLFLKVGTCWEIRSLLSLLQEAGIDLEGLYVVRRCPEPGQRRLVGKISSFSNGTVYLSESFDEINSINENQVWLEGSKKSFTRCLKTLLGNQYRKFETERDSAEGNLLTGPALEEALTTLGNYLHQKSPLQIAPDLRGHIGDRIKAVNDSNYKTVISASPVEYCFDAARTKRDKYSFRGISNYGPFSRESFSKKSPEILIFFPDTVQGAVENFLGTFRDGVSIKKKIKNNEVEYWSENSRYIGGFAKIFGLANPKFVMHKIPWLKHTNVSPAIAYKNEIEQVLKNREHKADAAIVVLLEEHSRLPDAINPYLQSKALLLMAGIPVQSIRVSTLGQVNWSLQYSLQSFSVALYAKMNGIPWTVDQDLTISDELVIGIGNCELSDSRFTEKQRFVGITTVFRGDGNYLLGNMSKECSYDEYPSVLRRSTTSILQEIKQRNGWQPGDTVRLVFHAARPMKYVDISSIIAECVAEVAQEQIIEFAFLTVSQAHPFSVTDKSQPGVLVKGADYGSQTRKGIYVPARGKIAQLGRYTRLLCSNSPNMIKKITSPLPTPLLINLHPQSTYRDLTYLSEQVLKFTSLSWRSVLPISKPVTIYYSELISELLARLQNIKDWSPAMLNIQLRASKWFL